MIRLIGGEMPGWSEDHPPAGGALYGYLAEQLPAGSSVLVAGPHEDALIDALAARATVTCLVRSQPEAERLAARGLDVLCGTLTKLTDTDRWDAVVALDGLGRLCSVEGPQYGWAECLQVLKRALRPGGALLLAVENELGVHRLVDPVAATATRADDAWRPLGEFDDSKPGTPGRLIAGLDAEGLAVDWLGAAWPEPGSPTMIATPDALRDGPAGALAAAVASAVGTAYANRGVLSDPRRLAAAAVRSGLGPELATAWLVITHRTPGPAPALRPPAVLLGDGPVLEVTPGPDGGWTRHVLREVPGRDTSALDGPWPAGRLLEELLLSACLRHDLPTVRRLLTGWMAALPGATADNVVVDGDTYARLDPGVPARDDALRGFATMLLTGGYAHPWPAATDLRTLTAILHGAAGLPGDVPAIPPGENPPVPDSRREQLEQLRSLRRRLADAAARAEEYEREIAKRDAELTKARAQIATFSGSFGYRMAKLGYGVARKARQRVRKKA
ncbi:hypothetical protein ODJ79_38970 [Actinoplanes sp. KI2]|uniref:hypothetical protein n=1 Tax=Actinoplanes sp. KI2 TaxID=2983315 RepID=UPI0021D6094C|nr:hypothetical protein [Actinoplanes sp. KI2]MCU7729736.1 hypothetical protein [Actinoplanes sp. KI2]